MKWFRIYSEARTDAKLESLTDAQHRVWFRLMCFAGDQDDRGMIHGYDLDLLAVEVARGDVELLTATLERLVKLRIIATGDDDVQFVNWEKRQYDKPSDTPESTRERKRKSRASSNIEDPVTRTSRDVTPSHDTYTEAEADTESDADSENTPAAAARAGEPVELTALDCKIAGIVKQIPGMAAVPETDIVLHLRDVLSIRGSPLTAETLIAETMKFRDHWTEKRSGAKPNEKWTRWKVGATNWFDRVNDSPRPINGKRGNDNVSAGLEALQQVGQAYRRQAG